MTKSKKGRQHNGVSEGHKFKNENIGPTTRQEFLKEEEIRKNFHNIKDMFDLKNFEQLKASIINYTTYDDEDKMKSGLKVNLNFILVNAAKVFKATAYLEDNQSEAEIFQTFLDALQLMQNCIFGDAIKEQSARKQTALGLPGFLPLKDDVAALRSYMVNNAIAELVEDASNESNFVKLRDLTCCSLTIFNAGRGGKPSRILLGQYEDALKGKWVDKNRVNEIKLDAIEQRFLETT